MKHKHIIDTLTLEEKAALMSGKSVWETKDIPEKGIPSIFLSDGPHGIRKQEGDGDHLGLNASIPATCFPTAATLANSWDPELVEEVGSALGAEARSLGVQMVLGPGLNIKRSPLCGRNFEYYSEDPYQSGKMAAAMVRGIQSQGIAATPKHFAVNSQELRRMASDSIVDERTLRELYLTGFEIAVKEGHPKALMSSYNLINGVYANEDKKLLQDILRDEWGFDGLVVSDWGGSNDHVKGVASGSHLEMPGTKSIGQKEIVDAVQSGYLQEELLDQRVDELLDVVFELAVVDRQPIDPSKQHDLARKAARESIVLLKNEEKALPLSKGERVALIGEFAQHPRYQGAGSSLIQAKNLENTLSAIQDYPLQFVGFASGYQRTDRPDEGLIDEAVRLAKQADTLLLYLGLDEISESEGLDRSHLSLPKNQLQLVEALVKLEKKIVVVLSAGSVLDLSWDEQVDAVVHGYLSGEAGATALLDVLTGRANPSGRLSESYPYALSDIPSSRDFPAKGLYSYYREALYVGYRYFTSVERAVKYPFGFGLSYSHFTYHDLQVKADGIELSLTNTGDVAGAEVVQFYVGKKDSKIYRPSLELKGFQKVFLKAGESKRVQIPFDEWTFRYFNVETGAFEVEEGLYQLYVGANVEELSLSAEVNRKGTTDRYPSQENLPSYWSGHVEEGSDQEFAVLLGHELPIEGIAKGRDLGLNDPLLKMQYAKSWIARRVYHLLDRRLQKAERKGIPDLNLLFLYNMPFRALAKMTGDRIDQAMVTAILHIVNGHFFKGLGKLASAYRAKRHYQKTLS
ncbi:glycoside hydrolase family 3 C-terminal domain-containing protein [Streptococcus sp. DD13]|uniref:glycoside hydrolase family 3 C-terminal domain-containing protein n=1 Tax=Streptococcus sp. DD13 TaxID=1777881 RepID=UPI000791B4BD|nr:glycoside hydrolase family 3 C-terminal domain-containing protein [Streptococcus sp. DD13]KXT79030.1 Beta-glucosidase [Streptococcus sp. DD13]